MPSEVSIVTIEINFSANDSTPWTPERTVVIMFKETVKNQVRVLPNPLKVN